MKNTTFKQPYYGYDYSTIQMVLPLDLSFLFDKSDVVVSFVEAIKEVNFEKYVKPITSHNTNSHSRTMLLKVLLFAHMENKRSLSEIADACKHDIRYMWLSNEEKPSTMAFSRLINQLVCTIDDIFFDLNKLLVGNMSINTDIQFVDGTKIEANAHKNSFVYKKRILNARASLFTKITDFIFRLNFEYGYNYKVNNFYCSQELLYILQYLLETIVSLNIDFVYGKGKKKTKIQRFYDEIAGYYQKLCEYEYWLDIIQDRNSCSKTDFDATFMATKWDYYNQSGITRPCYNAQIAVSDGIIVNADIYQRPGDIKTYIPFMERYKENYGQYPKYPVADAGYGCYENYMFNIRNHIELVQKYNMYGKIDDPKFKKRIYDSRNWKTNEEGYRICPDGRVFDEYVKDTYSYDQYLQIKQVYIEKNRCEGCTKQCECFKKENTKTTHRSYYKNVVQQEMYEKVNENLSTEFGIWLRKQRCAQVEGVFGSIKQNAKFTRFTRRGLRYVKMEFLLVCIGHNLRKYHQFRMEKYNRPSSKWDVN